MNNTGLTPPGLTIFFLKNIMMMKRIIITAVIVLFVSLIASAQNIEVFPTNWWVGMKMNKIQLMVHGNSIGSFKRVSCNYPGVKITKVDRAKSNNYLFIDISISNVAKAGKFKITCASVDMVRDFNYELKPRRFGKGKSFAQGITSADLIYLLMPDRFSNGDPSNDKFGDMNDTVVNRSIGARRHGGDLKGIEQKLNYLQDLGATALWLNPIVQNDMPVYMESGRYNAGFHGYWQTEHYKVDRRLGGNEAYHHLIDAMHNKGLKIIQDVVYDFVGEKHFLYKDMPDSSWFHWWPTYTNTAYKDQVLMDPYASAIDKKIMSNGWFAKHLPDLNQENQQVVNFLIQNSLWWTEEFGLDGWRMDTYAYNNLEFLNKNNKALLDEYPSIGIFAETWVHGVPNQSFFTANKLKGINFESNLPGVTDFQLNLYGIYNALNQPFGWTEGVNRLYTTLSNDFIYKDPMKNVIFLDNHDVSRFYSSINKDMRKYKMGIAWLMTCRGIPQLYYGTEILMEGQTNPSDDFVRKDFLGGWEEDSVDKFTAAGRTADENEAYNYLKTFTRFRLSSSAIRTGKMMQYVPEEGVYVYFRYDNNQTVMVVMNQNDGEKTINLPRFAERINGFTKAMDVATSTTFNLSDKLSIGGKYTLVLELKK